MNKQKFVGVDTHKDTLACYVDGKFKEFKTTQSGFQQALKWAPDAKWAVEGAYCFGQPFTAFLIKNGKDVYEVNPLLTKTWRGVISTTSPKNDYGDAKVILLFADSTNLQKVSLKTTKLKENLTTRKLFVKQRTEITNSIKMLFNTRGEKLPFNDLYTQKAINWLLNKDDLILQSQGKTLAIITENIKNLEAEISKLIPEKAKKLTELKGISDIYAATIYTETKGRLISAKSFANYAGVAPVEFSSGKTRRFRNNKAGNRILNSCFYTLSIAQKRYDPEAKKYYEKKIAEGKTPRHARKCLARQLVNIVYKILKD
ncbi:MAG: IS110 family transposase [Candidatus Gastranaerophilales bacterium]